MNINEQTLRSLIPEDGHYLTQAGEVPDNNRIFTTFVMLSNNDSASNWKEVTKKEGDEFKAKVAEEQRKAIEKANNEAKIAELEQELKALKDE